MKTYLYLKRIRIRSDNIDLYQALLNKKLNLTTASIYFCRSVKKAKEIYKILIGIEYHKGNTKIDKKGHIIFPNCGMAMKEVVNGLWSRVGYIPVAKVNGGIVSFYTHKMYQKNIPNSLQFIQSR